jgi:hypothetical protein
LVLLDLLQRHGKLRLCVATPDASSLECAAFVHHQRPDFGFAVNAASAMYFEALFHFADAFDESSDYQTVGVYGSPNDASWGYGNFAFGKDGTLDGPFDPQAFSACMNFAFP